MGRKIPTQFIDELLSRTDIVAVVESRVPLKKAGKEFKACCPFHQEKTPSFTVSQQKQFYHCFGCGAHGSAIGFLMEYAHMSFPEAIEELADSVGLTIPQDSDQNDGDSQRKQQIEDILVAANQYFQTQLKNHQQAASAVDYLKQRGLSGEIAKKFGLGYSPDGWRNLLGHMQQQGVSETQLIDSGLAIKKDQAGAYDRFRSRIMFPIWNYRDRLIGFGGRIVGEGEPKYLNSPETAVFSKGFEVYGLNLAKNAVRQSQWVLVVEGYMDVISLAQHGIENCVATLGTATTRQHLEKLFRICPRIVFCFDGDRAGRQAAWRALEAALPLLLDGRQVEFLFLDEEEDPDSMVRKIGREALLAKIRSALPLPEYLIDELSGQVDLQRLDGKAKLVTLAKPLIDNIPNGILHDLIVDKIRELSQTDEKSLSQQGIALSPRSRPAGRPNALRNSGSPSLVKRAIAMLLQNPPLGEEAASLLELRNLQLPGIELLIDLALQLEANPALTTANLVERFRESDHYKHLEKLAVWPHLVPDEHIRSEFSGIVKKLREKLANQRIESLLEKSQQDSLSPQEKQELLEILAESGGRSA